MNRIQQEPLIFPKKMIGGMANILPGRNTVTALLLAICFLGNNAVSAQSMGISSSSITPDASSILDLRTTSKGLLIPRMTTAQRDAISSPAAGLMIYNTSTSKFDYYNGSSWISLFAGTSGVNSVSGTTNRISIGGTASDPIVDIASGYTGQSSITTLGTIATGTWNGTLVNPTYGGTGVNNGNKTITLGGNLATSGAFATTLTSTAATNVTLPTTGTLATLNGTETFTNKTIDGATNTLTNIPASSLTGTLAAAQFPSLTGDVTNTAGSLATTIANNAVTNAKLAQVATQIFKGRTTAGTGNVEDLTATQATAMLNNFTSTTKGLAPLSGGGTINFLRADGTWTDPTGSLNSSFWAHNGNSVASEKSLGTTSNFALPFITNNTEKMRISAAGNVGIGTSTFDATNPEKLAISAGATSSFNLIKATGSIDNYLQLNIQNNSAGNNASSDVVATADNGTESVNYVDMGINSSTFSNATYPVIGGINNAYLYSTGNDFIIGNATAAKPLRFFTGGTANSNERMRIDGSGNVSIGNTTASELLTLGTAGSTAGTLSLAGATSGKAILTAAAAAGSPTLTLPTATGTLATLDGTETFTNKTISGLNNTLTNINISSLTGTLGVTSGGTGTATSFTPGSLVFAGTSGIYNQNNSKLFWNNTNFRLGIGTASPNCGLQVGAVSAGSDNILIGGTASPGFMINTPGSDFGTFYSTAANTVGIGFTPTVTVPSLPVFKVNKTGAATFGTSVATDDNIIIQPFTGGSNSFAGTLTSADITAARTYTLPNASGTIPVSASGNIALSAGGDISFTGTLPVANGGTGQSSYTDGQLLIGNSTGNTLTKSTLTAGSGISVTNAGGSITIANTSPSSGGTVTTASVVSANGFAGTVANASTTPAITLSTTASGVLKGNGTAISAATSGTDYSAGTSALATGILKSTTATGALSIAAAGTDFVAPNSAITGATNTKITYDSKGLVTAGSQATASDLSNGTTGSGNIVLAGSPTLTTPTLGVASSTSETITGTAGAGYLELQTQSSAPPSGAANSNRLFSNSTGGLAWKKQTDGFLRSFVSTFTADRTFTLPNASGTVAVSASGNIALSGSGDVSFTGTLPEANGGTGNSSYAVGDILYASGSTTLSKLAGVATGSALISGGVTTAPSWGKIGLTTHVSGTLPVANGGTGATALTSNGVLYGNGTGTVQVTAASTGIGQVLQTATSGGAPAWAAGATIITLGSDVVNNNGTANTMQDVTGLSFAVTAGVTYRFRALIIYNSAITSTGSRWSINGPASPTLLGLNERYSLTTASETVNFVNGYDLPAAANASSANTTGNIATIDGIITPSANGTVIVRFASEVSSSAITAKAGSTLTWW